jgi:DNA-3-methyladenine glycosylase
MEKVDLGFYERTNVLKIANDLLGKLMVTSWNGKQSIGRIVEVEAYNGIVDKASHAFGGRRTSRTEIMYGRGGTAYVYLCYGIHHLFNIVTNKRDIPHAVLIRALEPVEGIDLMLQRTGKVKADHSLASGPGNVSKAMGILTRHSGEDLLGKQIFLAYDNFTLRKSDIIVTPRIGVDYAAEDADLPYRLFIRNNPCVSAGRKFVEYVR